MNVEVLNAPYRLLSGSEMAHIHSSTKWVTRFYMQLRVQRSTHSLIQAGLVQLPLLTSIGIMSVIIHRRDVLMITVTMMVLRTSYTMELYKYMALGILVHLDTTLQAQSRYFY